MRMPKKELELNRPAAATSAAAVAITKDEKKIDELWKTGTNEILCECVCLVLWSYDAVLEPLTHKSYFFLYILVAITYNPILKHISNICHLVTSF